MINRLQGKLIEKQPPSILLEVANAFTYELFASMHTFYQLPEVGQNILLYTHFIVREEGHYLYAFSAPQERYLFIQLLKVNGIGPKVALSILSKLEGSALIECIQQHDITTLQTVPGIGKKTAERLIIEMKDRLKTLNTSTPSNKISTDKQEKRHSTIRDDAISALIALGYKTQEATRSVLSIQHADLSVESLIRLALKNIV